MFGRGGAKGDKGGIPSGQRLVFGLGQQSRFH